MFLFLVRSLRLVCVTSILYSTSPNFLLVKFVHYFLGNSLFARWRHQSTTTRIFQFDVFFVETRVLFRKSRFHKSPFLYLSLCTLHSSSLWRTDTTIFAPHPLSTKSPVSISEAPSNVFEMNKAPGGLIEDLRYYHFDDNKWRPRIYTCGTFCNHFPNSSILGRMF